MLERQFRRKLEVALPQGNIVFLDEICKSNEPTLDILMSIFNEEFLEEIKNKSEV